MTASLTLSLFKRLSPLRLAGPLFEKELRVSSRQRMYNGRHGVDHFEEAHIGNIAAGSMSCGLATLRSWVFSP